jgi:hypothetical protein
MSDDKTKRGSQDRTRINLDEKYEVAYWTQKLGVSEEELRAAVGRVGNSSARVEEELRRKAS